MTAQQIIDRARLMLADTDHGNYRWPNAELLGYITDGVDELVRSRPDVLLTEAGTMGAAPTAALVSSELGMDSFLTMPLAHYVAFRALTNDSADGSNAQAAEVHRGYWMMGIKGG